MTGTGNIQFPMRLERGVKKNGDGFHSPVYFGFAGLVVRKGKRRCVV